MKENKKELLKKMKEGRKKAEETKKELNGVVCKIKDGKNEYIISATPYQYSLMINKNEESKTYHPSIENVLDELLEIKEKKLMIISKQKDLLSVRQAVLDARKWMKHVVAPLIRTDHSNKS